MVVGTPAHASSALLFCWEEISEFLCIAVDCENRAMQKNDVHELCVNGAMAAWPSFAGAEGSSTRDFRSRWICQLDHFGNLE